MLFFTNLRSQAIRAFEEHDYKPKAWLLSTHRLNRRSLKLALAVRKQKLPLFADNGSKNLIDKVIKRYRKGATKLSSEIRQIKKNLNRDIQEDDLPIEIKQKTAVLVRRVIRKCDRLSNRIKWKKLLNRQLKMKPTHLIAQEDFSTACLIGLDLEMEFTGLSKRNIKKQNERSINFWNRVIKDKRCDNLKVYTVLSAMDYETAFEAGKLAAKNGVENIAWGIASIMLDMNTINSYVLGNHKIDLEIPVRRRFVRFALILRGLIDGFKIENKSIKAFHGLGLGAPILYPILVLVMDPETKLSIDSTSPILNAVKLLTLFDPEKDGDRTSCLKIIEKIVDGENWVFKCPFCKAFRKKFGHHPEKAKKWWVKNGKPKILKKDIKANKPLAKLVPLFTKHKKFTKIKGSSDSCRVCHNHWVIEKILADIPSGKDRVNWAKKKVAIMISTYERSSASKNLNVMKNIVLAKDSTIS